MKFQMLVVPLFLKGKEGKDCKNTVQPYPWKELIILLPDIFPRSPSISERLEL